MGRPAGWMKELTGRSAMKSPGAPSLRRDVERLFWHEIAKGLSSEEAALAVGASQAAGTRWFRERGGMPTFMLAPLCGRYLCFEEREEIALLRAQGAGIREIARQVGRSPSTISRELRRNAATRSGQARLPRLGRAVEGGFVRSTTKDRQTRGRRSVARVCAGATFWPGSSAKRDRDRP